MTVAGCVSADDVYETVDWRTLMLLAGLMPLGIAMSESGAAQFIVDHTIGSQHPPRSRLLHHFPETIRNGVRGQGRKRRRADDPRQLQEGERPPHCNRRQPHRLTTMSRRQRQDQVC